MAENKKTTKKAAPKKGTAAASKNTAAKKPAAKKPAAKKPAAKKPTTVQTVVEQAISVAEKTGEEYYGEMMDVIDSIMKRADGAIPETVTIQTNVAKSWVRRFFGKLVPARRKK